MDNPIPGQIIGLRSQPLRDGTWVLAAEAFTPTGENPVQTTVGRLIVASDGGEGAVRFIPDAELREFGPPHSSNQPVQRPVGA